MMCKRELEPRKVGTAGSVIMLVMLTIGFADAQGVRDRTRLNYEPGTTVNESQAVELTLTLVKTGNQALQTWVRTAATIDESGRILAASLCSPEAELLELGQRVRSFPPDSKSSIYQARITRIRPKPRASQQRDPQYKQPEKFCIDIEATLAGKTYEQSARYVMEIIVQRGNYLAIPNEAIIEEGDSQVVYVQMQAEQYAPRQIQTGLKGELYTEVLDGLSNGEQVVTLGSFFIDAEHKLKAVAQDAMSNAHLHH